MVKTQETPWSERSSRPNFVKSYLSCLNLTFLLREVGRPLIWRTGWGARVPLCLTRRDSQHMVYTGSLNIFFSLSKLSLVQICLIYISETPPSFLNLSFWLPFLTFAASLFFIFPEIPSWVSSSNIITRETILSFPKVPLGHKQELPPTLSHTWKDSFGSKLPSSPCLPSTFMPRSGNDFTFWWHWERGILCVNVALDC